MFEIHMKTRYNSRRQLTSHSHLYSRAPDCLSPTQKQLSRFNVPFWLPQDVLLHFPSEISWKPRTSVIIKFLLIDFIFIKQPAAAQDYHLWSWFCFILLLGGKMRNIAMQLVLQQCCKTSCMFLLPFSPCLNILYSLFFTSVNLTIPLNSSHLTTTTEHN